MNDIALFHNGLQQAFSAMKQIRGTTCHFQAEYIMNLNNHIEDSEGMNFTFLKVYSNA